MSEAQYVVVVLIGGLGAVAFFMIKNWARNWETTLVAHDERLGRHDVEIATITANMEHIRVTGDETRDDVKELLRQSNGARSTGGGQQTP